MEKKKPVKSVDFYKLLSTERLTSFSIYVIEKIETMTGK